MRCTSSNSPEVDADPAAQPSTIQQVRQMPRSDENRYLPPDLDQVRTRAAHAVDLADDRDNFRDRF
jgi:hypothetical protein